MHQGRAVRVVGVHSDGRIHLKVEGAQQYIWSDVSMIEAFVADTPQRTIRAPSESDPEQEEKAVQWCDLLARIAALDDSALRRSEAGRVASEMGV